MDDEVPREFIDTLNQANNESLKTIRQKAISLLDAQLCTEHTQSIPFSRQVKDG